jgi:hypothetical protein
MMALPTAALPLVILGGNPRLQRRQYYEDVFTGKEMDRSTD